MTKKGFELFSTEHILIVLFLTEHNLIVLFSTEHNLVIVPFAEDETEGSAGADPIKLFNLHRR
jgi:hypothetical protein